MVELACVLVHFVLISPIFACFSIAMYPGLELLCTCRFKLLHVQELSVVQMQLWCWDREVVRCF